MTMEVFTGIVLLDNEQRIYLIKEDDKNKIGQNRWNLPGGSVDVDEGIIESAKRETLEETGYVAEPISIVGCYKAKKGAAAWVYVVLYAKAEGREQRQVEDAAVKEGRWFSQEDFLKTDVSLMVHPDMKLVYKIAVEGRGLPLESVKFIDYDNG